MALQKCGGVKVRKKVLLTEQTKNNIKGASVIFLIRNDKVLYVNLKRT